METLPNDLTATKKTPSFSRDGVPRGLLKEHSTKPGTWGLLTVEEGEIMYVITERGSEEEVLVTPGNPGVIEPETKHHVRIIGHVLFHIQFFA